MKIKIFFLLLILNFIFIVCNPKSKYSGVIGKVIEGGERRIYFLNGEKIAEEKVIINNKIYSQIYKVDGVIPDGIVRIYGYNKKTGESSEVITAEFEFKNNLRNGFSKVYFIDTRILHIVSYFKDGKIDGIGKLFYLTGELKEIMNFKDGLADGEVKTFYKDSVLKMKRYYINGELSGWEYHYDKYGNLVNKKYH